MITLAECQCCRESRVLVQVLQKMAEGRVLVRMLQRGQSASAKTAKVAEQKAWKCTCQKFGPNRQPESSKFAKPKQAVVVHNEYLTHKDNSVG